MQGFGCAGLRFSVEALGLVSSIRHGLVVHAHYEGRRY